ncbi:GntR family transcriptional regulator [Streptomyces sp. SID14515]|uniref:GntR family transcriptional regulator n=1 Tax=Streptomyces sp. SID14515 TaxID=2706074 RepID=UPI0013CD46DC|nr:GntR family transcriptional regulator [Streptomyces sp. SID14515]NEB42302.1 GntR family transcriptional regulator [Streptomyces sp. SID14515]
MSESPEHTALYRLYDADDVLLYVGISNDPDFRWKAHLYSRELWPKQVTRHVIEWWSTREEAVQAEEAAIKAERPRHNGKHNYDDAPFDPASWPTVSALHKVTSIAELIRGEITSGRWGRGQRIPSLRTLAEAVGASMRIASQASVLLQQEGLLEIRPGHGVFVAQATHRLAPTSAPKSSTPHSLANNERPKLPHDWYRAHGFPG